MALVGTTSVKTMVEIGDSLTSSVEGYETYGLLYDTTFSLSRIIGAGAGGQLEATAQITATPLVIKIASGIYIPDMETNFIKGTPFPEVTVAHLINSNGTNQLSEEILYENCYILKMEPSRDVKTNTAFVTLTLRAMIYTDTSYSYDDVTGLKSGQTSVSYDFARNVTNDEE